MIVLASGSKIRASLLRAAHVPFEAVPPGVDEQAVKAGLPGASPGQAAAILAERKALAVSAARPADLVIGADQTLEFEGRLYDKAESLGEAREVRVVNRTLARAQELAASIGGNVKAYAWTDLDAALGGAGALINGTSLGLEGNAPLQVDLRHLPKGAPVMDMVYRPLRTAFLQAADERGHPTIDGLDMLIGQAKPSFEAFFGRRPPAAVDVRTLCLDALERRG